MHFSFSKTTDGKPPPDERENQKRVGDVNFGGSVAHLRTEPQSSGQTSLGFLDLLVQTTPHDTRQMGAGLRVTTWDAGMGAV
jgi:hypothetical protein